MSRVLVIDDDDRIRSNLVELLENEGFAVKEASDGEAGMAAAVQELPDIVICDVTMPGMDGYEVLEVLSSRPSTASIPFIFLSARAERADVRRGMTLGADDYLTKPFTRTELLDSIRARLRRRRSTPPASRAGAPAESARPAGSNDDGGHTVVVHDPAMQEVFAQLDRVARSAISVMILGETGVGKEIVAEQVHRRSGRTGPFVPLNCAALPENLLESELFGHEKGAFTGALKAQEGLFESANGGTLFLDEIGDLPVSTQVKLLRVLQERKVMRVGGRSARSVDVRFVSATNRDVEQDVEEGSFRQDLFFRLNGISLVVPPLRARRGDIVPLAEHFVGLACRAEGKGRALRLSGAAREALDAYGWPGNVRELQSTAERAVLLCDGVELEPRHLARQIVRDAAAADPSKSPTRAKREQLLEEIEALEKQRVIDALGRSGGNQTKAAELLGISRRTLVTRLGSYDLPRPRKR